jgi:hypothetical protein
MPPRPRALINRAANGGFAMRSAAKAVEADVSASIAR